MDLKLAACRRPNVNPNWFTSDHHYYQQAAVAICNTCPLKQECLDLHGHDRYAVIGGTTSRDRHGNAKFRYTRRDFVDQVAVDRFVAGDRRVTLHSPAEKEEAARRLYEKGYPLYTAGKDDKANSIQGLMKWSNDTAANFLAGLDPRSVAAAKYAVGSGNPKGRT